MDGVCGEDLPVAGFFERVRQVVSETGCFVRVENDDNVRVFDTDEVPTGRESVRFDPYARTTKKACELNQRN